MQINVLEYLEASCNRVGNKIAFSDEVVSVSFLDLRAQSKKIASVLLNEHLVQEEFPGAVAVLMKKSVTSIVCFMSILYSGNYYAPFDENSPFDRLKTICCTLKPKVILVTSEYYDIARKLGFGDSSIINVDEVLQRSITVDEKKIQDVLERRIDTDPAYVLFTSGSTGMPKGVVISHRSLIDFTDWLQTYFHFDEKTVFANQAPFHFDMSVLELYSTLACGSLTHIVPPKYFGFPVRLLKFLEQSQVNTLCWVPTAFILVANSGALEKYAPTNIEKVLFCGEVMPNKALNVWRTHYPEALFVNMYGPTEITFACTVYAVNRSFSDDEPLPIGRAMRNTRILLLDENDECIEPSSVGRLGEICVGGSCLFSGYYGNWEKTNEALVQNPLNSYRLEKLYRTGDLAKYNDLGELIYMCRKDGQIKYQGHRIELGEIETHLGALGEVYNCCVLFNEHTQEITAFYAGQARQETVRSALESKLPPYMIPKVFHVLKNMPKNANGKIDRTLLKREYFDEAN